MSLPKRDTVEVELAAPDAKARRTLRLRVATSSPSYGTWPQAGSRVLEGNVGYLRLASMVTETFVLMNAKCFSATDIFLAGLKGMANVTLLGTPSGGGSAFTPDVILGATPLRLRIGSMVSFQADGRLVDGNGVRPDVVVEAAPEYYIGGRDNVLEEGVRRVRH
jgi:C-terminal processing protease CtpA/Prc